MNTENKIKINYNDVFFDLRNNDCLKELKKIKSNKIDCIVTSPPYWKGFEYEAYFNSYSQYLRWSKKWLKECKRVLKPNGTFFLNVINDSEITVRAFDLMNIATEKLMYKLHDTIIWYRYNQQPANTKRQLTNQCEFVFMLKHTSANTELNKIETFENNKHIFKTKNVGNVWEIPFNSGKKSIKSFGRKETKSSFGHSGYPLELPETCISLTTKKNDIVLDLFMGTGQTGIACKKLNRNFIGIEIDPDSFKLSKNRIENFEIQKKLKLK